MAVRDPDETGDMTPEEMDAARIGISRLHAANLLKGLGREQLSFTLRELINSRSGRSVQTKQQEALAALEAAQPQIPVEAQPLGPTDSLVGGWVTRAGLASEAHLSAEDQNTLQRLDLRPVFVGLERQFLKGVIIGDLELIRTRERDRIPDGTARTNGAGVWMLRPMRAS